MKHLVPMYDGHYLCFIGKGARDWQGRRLAVLLVGPRAGQKRWIADSELTWIEVAA